jgi:hypothetical protein
MQLISISNAVHKHETTKAASLMYLSRGGERNWNKRIFQMIHTLATLSGWDN